MLTCDGCGKEFNENDLIECDLCNDRYCKDCESTNLDSCNNDECNNYICDHCTEYDENKDMWVCNDCWYDKDDE